jgi:hypothetical protein
MAIILGSCGCGCGSTCEEVTTNCNFVLRKYDYNTQASVSWNSTATVDQIECYENPFGCVNYKFETLFDLCTGEGEVWEAVVTEDSSSLTALLGTYTIPYYDESIDFDNIGEVQLTAEEQSLPSPPCKFSYNFSFTPEDGVEYFIIAEPCVGSVTYNRNVRLEPDGRAYFRSEYDEKTKTCFIIQVFLPITPPATDPNAPESQ